MKLNYYDRDLSEGVEVRVWGAPRYYLVAFDTFESVAVVRYKGDYSIVPIEAIAFERPPAIEE